MDCKKAEEMTKVIYDHMPTYRQVREDSIKVFDGLTEMVRNEMKAIAFECVQQRGIESFCLKRKIPVDYQLMIDSSKTILDGYGSEFQAQIFQTAWRNFQYDLKELGWRIKLEDSTFETEARGVLESYTSSTEE